MSLKLYQHKLLSLTRGTKLNNDSQNHIAVKSCELGISHDWIVSLILQSAVVSLECSTRSCSP